MPLRPDTGFEHAEFVLLMNCVDRNSRMYGEHRVFRRYDAICLGKEASLLLASALILLEGWGGRILVPRRKQAIEMIALGMSHLRCDRVLS